MRIGRGRSRVLRWLLPLAALAAVLAVIAASRRGDAGAKTPFAVVERGDLRIEATTVGELQAVRSQSFGVPRLRSSSVKVVWLIPEGSSVAPGDTLARFDTNEILRRVEDLDSRFTSARANLDKLRAAQQARRSEMSAALDDRRAALRLAEIGVADMQYEAKVEQERAQLALQRAQLDLRQAESKLTAQESIDAAEITEQQVGIAALARQLEAEREALANHVIVAPTHGFVVYGTNWSGNRPQKIKVGDQLYYGGVVLELPDLSQMRVASWVNESRVNQLRPDLECEVRVDALPDTTFRGHISRVNVLGRELPDAEGVKVFDFDVTIAGRDDRLRPGMTTSVVVRVEELRDVLHAPIEAVHDDDHGLCVWRRAGRRLERVAVTTGKQNDFHVVLSSGVRAGDALALRDPNAPRAED
jgi:multidrug efflux pump subunit AcrA (membrane-fusion protein)